MARAAGNIRMTFPFSGSCSSALDIEKGMVCKKKLGVVRSLGGTCGAMYSTNRDSKFEPPPCSCCHADAASQGLFETPLGWTQHTTRLATRLPFM